MGHMSGVWVAVVVLGIASDVIRAVIPPAELLELSDALETAVVGFSTAESDGVRWQTAIEQAGEGNTHPAHQI
jgi:hypothetical protein